MTDTTTPTEDEQLVLIDGMAGEPADSIAPAGPAPAEPKPKRGPGRPRKVAAEPAATEAGPRGGRPGRKTTQEQRADKVAVMYGTLGEFAVFAAPFSPRAGEIGAAMTKHAAKLGAAWAQWAETSPRVRKLIDGMAVGGGAVAVLVAHLPILLAIAAPAPEAPDLDGLTGLDLAGMLDKLL